MIHVLLPDYRVRPLSFYLAMEEYLAARDAGEYFFMWQVEPTVIIGRNQHLLSEVNVDYCRHKGIDMVRRRSGGGCVYADMKNIMFSYITTSATVTNTFAGYTSLVASMLRSIGLDAEAGGRNDIMIDGRKVSGNAFYHRRGRAIVHGTMLYDTDIDEMLHAISPSHVKLTSKGVESVRSRVVNLTEVTDMSLDEFKCRAASYMCDSTLVLDGDEVSRIETIEQNYRAPGWLEGNIAADVQPTTRRVEGVGEFGISVSLKGGDIDQVSLTGDFFLLSDLDEAILDRLRGVSYDRDSIRKALSGVDVRQIIAGLDNEQLLEMII